MRGLGNHKSLDSSLDPKRRTGTPNPDFACILARVVDAGLPDAVAPLLF